MALFIDSHAHLADAAFDADRDEVLSRARSAGAKGVVCIGESIAAAERAHSISLAHPGYVWFTAGVHPHDAAEFDSSRDPDAIRSFAERGAVAIGECGLDYFYDNSPRDLQRRAFASQLVVARELDLPVVVHTREAEDDTRAMMLEAASAGVRGVLHCFTGSRALADAAMESGWYLSFSGVITFRKWGGNDLIQAMPADRLLVESDSPYLAPVPNRGKRNEPGWVAGTLGALARARDVSIDEMGASVIANTAALFGVAILDTA